MEGQTAEAGYAPQFNMGNTPLGRTVAKALIGLTAMGALAPATASAENTVASSMQPAPAGEVTHDTTLSIAGHDVDAESFSKSKVRVWANHRTVAKAEIKEAKRKGNCEFFTAEEIVKKGFKTQGHNGTGSGYAWENRDSTLCDLDNDGDFDVRAECGNKAKGVRPQPKKTENVLWVKSFKNVSAKVKDTANAMESATCHTANTSSMASAQASAKASGSIKLKSGVKAKGKGIKKLITDVKGKAALDASAYAYANAEAQCSESTTPTTPKPPTPPTPENPQPKFPPAVNLVGWQHILAGDIQEICSYESDQDNNIVGRTYSETGNGEFVSFQYPGDEAGEHCIKYKAGTESDNGTITVTVRDADNQTATDTENFPIVGPEDPRGQF